MNRSAQIFPKSANEEAQTQQNPTENDDQRPFEDASKRLLSVGRSGESDRPGVSKTIEQKAVEALTEEEGVRSRTLSNEEKDERLYQIMQSRTIDGKASPDSSVSGDTEDPTQSIFALRTDIFNGDSELYEDERADAVFDVDPEVRIYLTRSLIRPHLN